jgi:hypothetical protein
LLLELFGLWPKFLPYVLSFGLLGLRWLANVEVRTRAEYSTANSSIGGCSIIS